MEFTKVMIGREESTVRELTRCAARGEAIHRESAGGDDNKRRRGRNYRRAVRKQIGAAVGKEGSLRTCA
ncbi:hypothetical protein Tco_1381957 [Tanacetum coccineum]